MTDSKKSIGAHWVFAFILWPAIALMLFILATGPTAADDIVAFFAPFVVSALCGVAAFKISYSEIEGRKLWLVLNLGVSVLSLTIGLGFLALGIAFGHALKGA